MKTHDFFSRQKMISDYYEVYHFNDTKIKQVDLHHHDFYEVYMLLEGEVDYQIEGTTYRITPGGVVVVNTRELHQAIIVGDGATYSRFVFWINPHFLNSLSSDQSDLSLLFESVARRSAFQCDYEMQITLKALFSQLIDNENNCDFGRDLLLKSQITALIVQLIRYSQRPKLATLNIRNSQLVNRVIAYIESNISSDLDLDLLSNEFYISKYHLIREFKKYTGSTVHKYIVKKRLVHAKQLLLQNYSINHVSDICCFGDKSTFYRAFKGEYNMTPGQYCQLMNN